MRRLKSIRDMMFVHLEFKEGRFNVTEKKRWKLKERKDLANDDASLWILKSEKWVLPQLQGKGNQRLCQLRLHAVICMVVCAAENSPEHRGLTLLFNSPESCMGTRCGEVGVQGTGSQAELFKCTC